MGVDSAAHVGALEQARVRTGGRGGAPPVAVLAGGADVAVPARRGGALHAQARRARLRGLRAAARLHRLPLVLRRPQPADRRRSPRSTVVVEATERSGSLTTADFATQLGRPVGAVPGPVTSRFSAGTNGLLAAGAGVVRDTRDVLDQLLGPSAPSAAARRAAAGPARAAPARACSTRSSAATAASPSSRPTPARRRPGPRRTSPTSSCAASSGASSAAATSAPWSPGHDRGSRRAPASYPERHVRARRPPCSRSPAPTPAAAPGSRPT